MGGPPGRPRSLYVHVPFCVRRCSYCDFAVEATQEAPVGSWLEVIERELELTAGEQGWTEPLHLETLYIGGGTPSLLGRGAMSELARRLSAWAAWRPDEIEWTCEANPESFTEALAVDWREAGVNRVSLGVQTFHEPALRWMGRMHGPEGPGRAVAAARSAGLEDLSVDLIFGLPERLGRDWSHDLSLAMELEPQHISLYGLTAETGTPLGRWVREGRESLADEERYADEYLEAHQRLTAAGFEHYEVSNFARPGRRSKHNFAYWTGAPYAALGPGAHSYLPPVRRWNMRGWEAYRGALLNDTLPLEDQEVVEAEDRELERVWLGLRTSDGLPLSETSRGQAELAAEWVAGGLAVLDGGRLRLTADGWLLLDRLAVDFNTCARDGTKRRQD